MQLSFEDGYFKCYTRSFILYLKLLRTQGRIGVNSSLNSCAPAKQSNAHRIGALAIFSEHFKISMIINYMNKRGCFVGIDVA
jgi:hypothetical protein